MNRFYLLGPTCQGQMNSACAAMEKNRQQNTKAGNCFVMTRKGFERRGGRKKKDRLLHA